LVSGPAEGCYNDWSLDLLVAKKVGEVISFRNEATGCIW